VADARAASALLRVAWALVTAASSDTTRAAEDWPDPPLRPPPDCPVDPDALVEDWPVDPEALGVVDVVDVVAVLPAAVMARVNALVRLDWLIVSAC